MDKKSTYGLKLDQLAGLFSLGIDSPVEGREGQQRMAELLHQHLTAVLRAGPLLLDALITMVGRLGYDTQALGGKTLVEVLLNSRTDLGLLRAIKECCKRLSGSLESKAEAAIATTLYYAAVASALRHHDKKITQHSYAALDEAFALLLEKPWMDPELVRLFSGARGLCQGKGGPQ
jgi:hypothetical protein